MKISQEMLEKGLYGRKDREGQRIYGDREIEN